MDTQVVRIHGEKGEIYCRNSGWMDVVKFFFLNYALHAFTVITKPGAGILDVVRRTLWAMIMPLSGMTWAIEVISWFAIGSKSHLERAVVAGALCMVVPSDTFQSYTTIDPMTSVHGQHPVPVRSAWTYPKSLLSVSRRAESPADQETAPPEVTYKLVIVPRHFIVHPLLGKDKSSTEISSNYSILKSFAALIQILYGSFELYQARLFQIEKLGYAAYSLTVLPYILMSFINLIASICQPSYTSMYIVYYRGKLPGGETQISETPLDKKETSRVVSTRLRRPETEVETDQVKPPQSTIRSANQELLAEDDRAEWIEEVEAKISGAVGCVYGDPEWSQGNTGPKHNRRAYIQKICAMILFVLISATPYIIIFLLTGFEKRQSTKSQRGWIISIFVMGQATHIIFVNLRGLLENSDLLPRLGKGYTYRFMFSLFYGLVVSGPIVAGFVVVAKMMLQDELCTKL